MSAAINFNEDSHGCADAEKFSFGIRLRLHQTRHYIQSQWVNATCSFSRTSLRRRRCRCQSLSRDNFGRLDEDTNLWHTDAGCTGCVPCKTVRGAQNVAKKESNNNEIKNNDVINNRCSCCMIGCECSFRGSIEHVALPKPIRGQSSNVTCCAITFFINVFSRWKDICKNLK